MPVMETDETVGKWRLLDTGTNRAEANMEIDRNLLEAMRPGDRPILHLYDWERDSVTYGHFIRPERDLKLDELERRKIDIAKRPTGGGMLFHIGDLTFSVLVPSGSSHFSLDTFANYRFVNGAVRRAVARFMSGRLDPPFLLGEGQGAPDPRFCMAKPTPYDVMIRGKKIAGAAQRRKKQGYLHQGSINLAMPDKALLETVIIEPGPILAKMEAYTLPLLPRGYGSSDLRKARKKMGYLLWESFLAEKGR
ncbi:MAG: hypothetical protein OXF02_05215 [Simkaniaceae bacterium]|nr:hypothetical protein [Simkaniaceae bacterium]